ncbi:MAG TPA: DUF2845 domain-containing protein [Xanthomonadaceae bacterium]|nr:DUF2845 domain-containing protein [Xanthomonadaceae bacterium]
MRGFGHSILTGSLAVLVAAAAVADSMRCGGYVVNTGDSQSRVLELCGEPQRAWNDGFIEQAVRRQDGYYSVDPAPLPYPRQPGYETEYRRVIPVYKWEYNLGRGTFLKTLVFHGDVLVRIGDGPRQ